MPADAAKAKAGARRTQRRAKRERSSGGKFRRIAVAVLALAAMFYGSIFLALLLLRWAAPPTTAVHVERRISAWEQGKPYARHYRFVPLSAISAHLLHAVVSAEDARFFQHGGFDWKEVDNAIQEDLENGRKRGASTIDQQLVRNLFLSTAPSVIRKALEFSIVPLAEIALPKRRILELYLNVVEWGPGIYGAEAAASRMKSICSSSSLSVQGIVNCCTSKTLPMSGSIASRNCRRCVSG